MERMIETFSEQAGGNTEEDDLSSEELAAAEVLFKSTYGSRDWLQTIP